MPTDDPGSVIASAAAPRRDASEAGELHRVAELTKLRLERVTRPQLALRTGIALLVALVGGLAATLVVSVFSDLPGGVEDVSDFLQLLESGLNDVVFLGVALVSLFTVENRIKRRRALRHIHELRALAHIVDMHQLGKDPDRLIRGVASTRDIPKRVLTRQQMGRYLDFSSEMLSLTGKVAALYSEHLDDPVVLQAVDEVETLTTGLSRKIWQKIIVLDRSPMPHGSTADASGAASEAVSPRR